MRKLIVLVTVSILSLAMFNVFAQGFGYRDGDRDRLRDRIHDKLNLTEDQESAIEDLRISHQKQMIEFRADIEKKELELQQLKNKDDYTRDEYIAITEEINNIRSTMHLARANHHMDVYELLDSNQKEIWNKFERKYPRHKGNFRQHRYAPRFD